MDVCGILQVLARPRHCKFLHVLLATALLCSCDSAISDWVGGSRGSQPDSLNPTTVPVLKLSGIPTSVPSGYPLRGLLELQHAAGGAIYSIFNSTCDGLDINASTGTVSGVIGPTVGSTCTYQVRATLGSANYELPPKSLSVDSTYTISVSRTTLNLVKGGSSQSVDLILSSPAPFDSYLSYKLYSLSNVPTAIDGYSSSGQIFIPSGASQVTLQFEVKSSSVLSAPDFQMLQIEDGSALFRPTLNFNLSVVNPAAFAKVSLGTGHGCSISAGKLYCWGVDSWGQLGNGATTGSITKPTQVGTSTTWQAVSSGGAQTCGIDAGRLFCWGSDSTGEVGNGAAGTTQVDTPVQIGSSITWQSVSTGNNHSCGIDAGALFCWGGGGQGQAGVGGTPFKVDSPTQIGVSTNWSKISAGNNTTCGINQGALFCWGNDSSGRVGNGGGSTADVLTPAQVGALTNWMDISVGLSSGNSHVCGIESGSLYCWGNDLYGQVGNGAGSSAVTSPGLVGSSTSWTQVSVSSDYSCGIDGGRLFCWGDNTYWRLGLSLSIASADVPTQVGDWTDWDQLSLGTNVACGLRSSSMYCWGNFTSASLGRGSFQVASVSSPEIVGQSTAWQNVELGGLSTCGIDAGRLYCWGNNTNGQLGNGSSDSGYYAPVPEQIGKTNSWLQSSSRGHHGCAIDAGKLHCWGSNSDGQSGTGVASGPIFSPVRIGTLSSWTSVSAGLNHTCGIASGKLYCWGIDTFGQIGNGAGSSASVLAPEQIGSSTNWQKVSSGYYHTCGIESGKLYCWGYDLRGQIGNGAGSSANVLDPEQIGSSTGWQQISSGGEHTCGIDGGSLYCWGYDTSGQVGNGSGSSANVTAPELIGVSATWQQVSSGAVHTCGINSSQLYCWGSDSVGQVGNGSAASTNVTAPELIGSFSDWQKVSTSGSNHSCGIRSGRLYCWGNNAYLQLGRYTPSSSPQIIIDF